MTVFLTTSTAGARLGVTRQTVHKLIKDGKLPALLVGTKYRIREEDVVAFIEKYWVGPRPVGYVSTAYEKIR